LDSSIGAELSATVVGFLSENDQFLSFFGNPAVRAVSPRHPSPSGAPDPASGNEVWVSRRGAAPSLGLRAREIPINIMPVAHAHSDVELNLLLRGRFTYLIAGQLRELTAGRLYLFWAGTLHRIVKCEEGTRQIWVTAPLHWLLRWGLPDRFVQRLLRGDLLADPEPATDITDVALLRRWVRDLGRSDKPIEQAVTLELEARLRRFAHAQRSPGAGTSAPATAAIARGMPGTPQDAGHQAVFARVAAHIQAHCTEDVPLSRLLRGTGVSPDYAGRIFKACCGLSPMEYRTRLRVAHAQRQLVFGGHSVTDVAMESGFGSLNRFYAAFRRICGETPRRYRLAIG
jgi:methylphosphotriester-DNA--protein-cysteine methyltransferase